jgi:SAM-dependent methyltransferase
MPTFNKILSLLANKLARSAHRMCPRKERLSLVTRLALAENHDLIPCGRYDCIPKDQCVFGDKTLFLLVPKNRYRAILLPDQVKTTERGVGWITEDNSPEGYDQLWGNSAHLDIYTSEGNHARERLKKEIVDKAVPLIGPSAHVADIGCGVGDLLGEIRSRAPGIRVSGLDFSTKAIAAARAAFPTGDFQQHVIDRTLPYADHSFDLVFCTDVLEHLEYPRLVAGELVRICKPGGHVVIVVPDGDVDQFFGHYWFWNQERLTTLLSPWKASVSRLPDTREFIAIIKA